LILVLGLGNPLRGDDGAGAWVAERLDDALPSDVRARLDVRLRPQLLPEMVEELADHEAVLIVDAAVEGPRVGFRRVPTDTPGGTPSSHHFTPEALAGLAKRLWGRSPEMYLITIRGERFELGNGISPDVIPRARRALTLAAAFLRRRSYARRSLHRTDRPVHP
jgi:hydrogenase maturation protease